MDFHTVGNVVYLHLRRRRTTHCTDCDPDAGRPFQLPVRADPRTDEILTPCPACGRFALVDSPVADGRVSGIDDC